MSVKEVEKSAKAEFYSIFLATKSSMELLESKSSPQ